MKTVSPAKTKSKTRSSAKREAETVKAPALKQEVMEELKQVFMKEKTIIIYQGGNEASSRPMGNSGLEAMALD